MISRKKDILNRISEAVRRNFPQAEIILFGSQARKTAHAGSDWDLLILLNKSTFSRSGEQEIRHALVDVEIETGEPISTFVVLKEEWEQKYRITPFYRSVTQEGIKIE